jgi:hypothetical protein
MQVVSFASAYFRFKQAHKLGDDVVGNMVDFKDYMLKNGIKIEEKDMLKNMYEVGKNKIENEERKVKKSEKKSEKKIATVEEVNQEFRADLREMQKRDRLWLVGWVVLVIILFFESKLHGYDPHEQMINEVKIELQNARKSAKEVVIPPSPVNCEGKKIKFDGYKYHQLKGEYTDYYTSLYGGFYTQSQKVWFAQNTALVGGKRVLCVSRERGSK